MLSYQRANNIAGWAVFVIAAFTYLSTIEPSVSFWDCGEFLSACYKMQVVHPPGAPAFLLLGRIAMLFGSPETGAMMVNGMNALASALTILFLFWSITHYARKLLDPTYCRTGQTETPTLPTDQLISILGAGAVGALCYTFSDSFWFSAVEAEVYALSSLFTAIAFWLALKWERVADEPNADRWLILLFYSLGFSIGVHLLNLLVIPAVALIVYYRQAKRVTLQGAAIAFGISIAVLGLIQGFLIPGLPGLAATFDRIFVNGLGMPFGAGIIVFCALFIGGVAFFLMRSAKRGQYVLNTSLLAVTFMIVGSLTYGAVLIRSQANPPLDNSDPENAYNFLSYLNREQYGDRPLLYGPYFTAEVVKVDKGKEKWRKGKERYESMGYDEVAVYNENVLFPRMYQKPGTQERHKNFYRSWMNLADGQKPSFAQNLYFFFDYQIGYMYLRYFLWNFAGRQNDNQGSYQEPNQGNWISGIGAIDSRLGPQNDLPRSMTDNWARNTYFMLPLILGLLGAIYHFRKGKHEAWVTLWFFFFTGLAIVIYLNQDPLQPRERDYAYTGSFYAFAIWVGLGTMFLIDLIRQRAKMVSPAVAAIGISVLCLVLVPGVMAQQNWNDHDRSGKYSARDIAVCYLESCAPNAILFTMGDNDTYPLWYAQEVEGIRTDVRVVNLSLLGTDWYVNQMRAQMNKSTPMKFKLKPEQYLQGTRDYVPFVDRGIAGYTPIGEVVDFISQESDEYRIALQSGAMTNFAPTKRLKIPVDRAKVLANGTVRPQDAALISDIEWDFPRTALFKNDLAVLDFLAQNNWERPVYFAISLPGEQLMGLDNYMQLEGMAYRLVPVKNTEQRIAGLGGRMASDIMYKNMSTKFKFGNLKDPHTYVDPESERMSFSMRANLWRLAETLQREGKNAEAEKILDLCIQEFPDNKIAYNGFLHARMAEVYGNLGKKEKAEKILQVLTKTSVDNLRYYTGVTGKKAEFYQRDASQDVQTLQDVAQQARQYGMADLAAKAEAAVRPYLQPQQMPEMQQQQPQAQPMPQIPAPAPTK